MREIRTSGLMSGDGKRGVATRPKPPRPSSTLQVKGKKRHLLVDTQGTLLKTKVHPADIHDRSGAEMLLSGLQHLFPAIELMWADTAYRGLKDWLQTALGWRLSITKH
jgi:putative transposase